jgi:hypothetical protein
MTSLADKVLGWLLDLEFFLQNLATNGLDVEFMESTLKKLAGDAKLLVELVW